MRTGASGRNWASYGEAVRLPKGLPEWRRDLLTDPQTSGGLLIAVAPERAEVLRTALTARAVPAADIGTITDEPGLVRIRRA